MFRDHLEIPWIEFEGVDTAGDPTFVRADIVVGIEKGPSGVHLTLMGGSFVRVKGTTRQVKQRLDDFAIEWEADRERRHLTIDAKIEEARNARSKP